MQIIKENLVQTWKNSSSSLQVSSLVSQIQLWHESVYLQENDIFNSDH